MPLCPSIYVGWSKPLAEVIALCLIKEARAGANVQTGQGPVQKCKGEGMPIDLGSHRVIVPSSFASRLIQEELAKQQPDGERII